MSFLDDLSAARDNLAAEIKNETARRAALTAAGKPPPVDYSLDGESFSFTGWLSAMSAKVKELNDTIISMGGDGGFADVVIHGY